MFWSLVLEPGKRYSSTVQESFHLSMATLDIKTCKNDNDIYPVLIEVDGVELILCNLSKLSNPHASLDLLFQKGSDITFSTNGKAIIHLTGYCIEDHSDDEDDYSSTDDEDESFNDLVENAKNASGKVELEGKSKNNDKQNANKRKLDPVEAVSKKKPKSVKDESDDDEDDSDSDADLDPSRLDELMDSVNTEGDSSDEDDSDLDDEEDDADDSEVEEEDDDDEEEDDDDDDESEDEKPKLKPSIKQEVKTPVSNKQKTPVSNKKQEKQQHKNQLTNGVTPQSSKKDKTKNQPTPKQDGQKTPNKDAQKTPKKGEPSPSAQRKQTLNGGVVVEDLRPGNGAPAKYGKMVQVYYTGRLKNNNRVFDKTTEGSGFRFRLGNGEVIKGWDVALNGMKVGGKRRITIPPGMAYGIKGSPPSIPPNSWLVFDVEMKSVN